MAIEKGHFRDSVLQHGQQLFAAVHLDITYSLNVSIVFAYYIGIDVENVNALQFPGLEVKGQAKVTVLRLVVE